MTEPQYARTLITPDACKHPAGTCTSATSAEVTTLTGHAPRKGACTRPLPWTPLQPFILEWELSNHPDKAFVRQLIHNLQHGCNIGYLGPQFAHLAKNLASASRQPKVINAALQKECEAGRILGPFQSLPLTKLSLIRLRLLYFRAAHYNINVCVMHIPGVHNNIADTLSRFQMIKACPNGKTVSSPRPPQSFINASCNAIIMELPPQLD